MDNKLVSVIIPVYNVQNYLKEALDSVINQTYKNLEIIIIDDGSTDKSGRICDKYARKDNRIKVFHQANYGLSTTRNLGLSRAHGDYIAFLDSDDAYFPNFIDIMLNSMIINNVKLVICRYEIHRTEGEMFHIGTEELEPARLKGGLYDRKKLLDAHINREINGHLCNKLYSREIWDNLRFLNRRVFEDIEIAYKAAYLAEKIYVLDKPFYKYRKRANSITTTMTIDGEHDRLLAFYNVDKFIVEHIPDVFTEEQLKRSRKLFMPIVEGYRKYLNEHKDMATKERTDILDLIDVSVNFS